MQAKTLLLLLSLALVPLSGCLGFGDEDTKDDTQSTDDCPTPGDAMEAGDDAMEESSDAMGNDTEGPLNGTVLATRMLQQNDTATGNETTDPEVMQTTMDDGAPACPELDDNGAVIPTGPNELPLPVLTMTTGDGTVLDGFIGILPGETITFSAAGSSDADGSVDLVGLIVKDTNSTRNAQLMADGTFTDVTMTFDHVGPVNITMRVLDNRGEGVVLNDMAYVNLMETGSADLVLYDPTAGGCTATGSATLPLLVTQQYFHKASILVAAGAKWISLESSGTDADAICAPDGTELVGGENPDGGDLPAGTSYYAGLHPSGPLETVSWTITVHYEPKAAA